MTEGEPAGRTGSQIQTLTWFVRLFGVNGGFGVTAIAAGAGFAGISIAARLDDPQAWNLNELIAGLAFAALLISIGALDRIVLQRPKDSRPKTENRPVTNELSVPEFSVLWLDHGLIRSRTLVAQAENGILPPILRQRILGVSEQYFDEIEQLSRGIMPVPFEGAVVAVVEVLSSATSSIKRIENWPPESGWMDVHLRPIEAATARGVQVSTVAVCDDMQDGLKKYLSLLLESGVRVYVLRRSSMFDVRLVTVCDEKVAFMLTDNPPNKHNDVTFQFDPAHVHEAMQVYLSAEARATLWTGTDLALP